MLPRYMQSICLRDHSQLQKCLLQKYLFSNVLPPSPGQRVGGRRISIENGAECQQSQQSWSAVLTVSGFRVCLRQPGPITVTPHGTGKPPALCHCKSFLAGFLIPCHREGNRQDATRSSKWMIPKVFCSWNTYKQDATQLNVLDNWSEWFYMEGWAPKARIHVVSCSSIWTKALHFL